ncbi:MAG TPA: hypothetical protein VF783_17520 [Terriglobales bacterium]
MLRDVLSEGHDMLGFAGGVPQQSEPAIAKDHAACAVNEVLFVFVCFALTLHEFRISLGAGSALLGGNNLIPLL